MFKHASAVLALTLAAASGFAQSTAFTYQGELKSAGQPASGAHDMQFKLFTAATGGVQIGSTVCLDNVNVISGRFAAQVDFGQAYTDVGARFLEISVRADTGLDCTNPSGFALLPARQPITAAPFAVHAKSAFALDGADGSPTNAVFVDNAGQVGINTTTPGTNFTIAGNMELGTSAGDYRNFRIGGGNSSGYLYGSFVAFADGIHMGYNYFADQTGANHIIRTDGQTSRLTLGYGSIIFATGGTNQVPANRVWLDQNGNLGLGSNVPASMLEVRGDIKLGTNAQFYAASASENLRIIRGRINGSAGIISGTGFTAQHANEGLYEIQFDTPFSGMPTVTVSLDDPGSPVLGTVFVTVSTLAPSQVWFTERTNDGTIANRFANFIAVGPK